MFIILVIGRDIWSLSLHMNELYMMDSQESTFFTAVDAETLAQN